MRITPLTLAALALTTTTASAGTKEDALHEAARHISMAWTNHDANDKRGVHALREDTASCLVAIDDALAAGATLDDDVVMPERHIDGYEIREVRNGNGLWDYLAPLRSGQALCKQLALIPDAVDLKLALVDPDIWLDKADDDVTKVQGSAHDAYEARTDADVIATMVAPCRAAIAHAREVGLPDATPVKLAHAGAITLGEADAKVCTRLETAAQAVIDADNARFEAMLAPYKAALTGEKLSTFLDDHMVNDTIYGKGGKEIATPEGLAKASAWFIVLDWEDDLGFTHWTVRKYTWKKNTLKSVKERSGCCDYPPSKAFK